MEEEIMKFAVSFYLLLFFVVYILVLTTLRGSPLSSTTGKICHITDFWDTFASQPTQKRVRKLPKSQ